MFVSGDGFTNPALERHNLNGQRFSAMDMDQDSSDYYHCAQEWEGGWWFNDCFRSNLNGRYVDGGSTTDTQGLIWYDWKGWDYSLKCTEMKIRPKF